MHINDLLRHIKQKHPEEATVIDAFAPLARAHVALIEEDANRQRKALEPFTAQTLPVNTGEALAVAEKLVEALTEGFMDHAEAFQAARTALEERPSPIKALCRAILSGDNAPINLFAKQKHMQDKEALSMLLLQTGRALAARASRRVRLNEKTTGEGASGQLCPCCHSPADMSILFDQEGKRLLHCSLCGHVWRYARTACPFCGTDKADNMELIFEEGHPEERAERCRQCDSYLLGVDARALDLSAPELAYYATLGMGHLDALAQEDGATPGIPGVQ